MPETKTEAKLEVQQLEIKKETSIAAPLDVTWDAVLLELGPGSELEDGTPFPMKLEPYPGGRWFRDLGDDTGHFWGHVQVIKPPKLLELTGPMFVSFPVMNHVQYRLTPDADTGGTHLTIIHRLFGLMPVDHVKGAHEGWAHGLKRIALIAGKILSERGGNAKGTK